MALSDAMQRKLNEQITHELFSSQVYLAMACQYDNQSLKLLAKWFRSQADEERGHAMKILDYLLSHGAAVKLGKIDAPQAEYTSVVDGIEAAYKHEQKVTGLIRDLVTAARQEGDYATENFLGWFVDEQVEEEDTTGHLLEVARMAGKNLLQLEAYVAHLARS